MESFLLIIRIILAAIFVLAGVGKFLDLKGSKKAIQDFGVPEILAKPFAVVLPAAEVVIAILLLFTQTSWYGAVGAFSLLAVFIGGMVVQMVKGNAPDCHCFGQIHSEPVGAKSLIRNVLFVVPALFLIASGRENQGLDILNSSNDLPEGNIMQIIFGLAIVGLLAAVVYFLKTISEQQTQIMRRIEILELTGGEGTAKSVEREDVAHPEKGLLIGSPAPAFTLPDLSGKPVSLEGLLAKRKPVLMLFVSPTCNPCGALLPEIEAWQNELRDRLNFVFVSSGKAKENAEKMGGTTLKQILLQNDREVAEQFGAQWTPTALLVNSDGTIASRAAAGDAAIRELIEKIKAESETEELFYFGKKDNGENTGVGAFVPEFSLKDVTGNEISQQDLRGKKTLLTYWGIGCGYCTQMLDELRDWDRSKGQDEPNLLLLSSGDREKNLEINLRSPIVLDDERKVAQKIGMTGTPSAVMINENGKIISEIAVGAEQIWNLLGKKK